jgi:light-regulated signal transduction histidine kinase (bacteriophytochrome)
VTALRHANGDLRGFSKILRDNTDRKRAEAEMQLQNQELTRINGELEEFAFVASHDLREPLRTINIYVQLLLNHVDLAGSPDVKKFADFIRSGVERMQLLMEDLLQYSRVTHADDEGIGKVDCQCALDEALKVLQARIVETGAQVKSTGMPTVLAQEEQVTLIFQNLISNSLKYSKTDQTPQIEISAKREDAQWVISIVDNGIGFAPKYAERIFGLFKRLHKGSYPGTGLGLAICKRVVERYGGRIWATSPGEQQGASVFFSLPAAEE